MAALDLHYLDGGHVAGTLIVLDDEFGSEAHVESLLEHIDLDLLPAVSFDNKNLSFTVIRGSLIGSFHNGE